MTGRSLLAALAIATIVALPSLVRADKKGFGGNGSGEEVITIDDGSNVPAGSAAGEAGSSGEDQDAQLGLARSTNNGGSDVQKQDLTGHDVSRRQNAYERDRFYVDKVDTPATANGTLIQGSFAETSFIYTETGGNFGNAAAAGSDASSLEEAYTELRYQSDFRHIGGGIWDARVDARIRLVDQVGLDGTGEADITNHPIGGAASGGTIEELKAQSGLFGGNEYDLRELYLVRNGDRGDVFIGRQYITDLGGVKIDGIRIDYASSSAWTLLGFGGLYPYLGSRSVLTDYVPLALVQPSGQLESEGRFIVSGGAGAAYRTPNAYGAIGGVVIAPLEGETPRVFATSNGYWRFGSMVDFYHYIVIDLVGSNAVNAGITNLSLGLNFKPSTALRITANFNQVDTQTLDVQAGAYLNSANTANTVIDNTTYVQRIATTEARVGISAGLGQYQRIELSTAFTYRYRPDLTLTSVGETPSATVTLDAEQSVEAYASILDRHWYGDLRLGLDALFSFGVGSISYGHTDFDTFRLSLAHDLAGGRGELEAEVSYTATSDNDQGQTCAIGTGATAFSGIEQCFGASSAGLLSAGGTLYYRLSHDWYGLLSAFVTQDAVTTDEIQGNKAVADPTITGLTGFLRIGYRF